MYLTLAIFQHLHTPLDPLHNDGYQFWSGIGSDLGEATVFVAAIAWWRHRNCQVRGCWRIHLRRPTEGGHYVCKRHHPDHEGNRLSLSYVNRTHEIGRTGRRPVVAARRAAREAQRRR